MAPTAGIYYSLGCYSEKSGGRALANGTYLQRAWRDAHAGRVHAANDPERALQMFGAHEFGHKIDPGMY